MEPELADARPVPLSLNLRKWRLQRKLTISALARKANLSKSTVSELERGNGNPSLDTLWALARSLNITLGTLFTDSSRHHEAGLTLFRDAPLIAHQGDGVTAHLLANWRSRGDLELAIVTLPAGTSRESRGNTTGVIERAVCTEGQVEVGTAQQSHLLSIGDTMTFAADQPHHYRAVNGPGRLVVVQQYPT